MYNKKQFFITFISIAVIAYIFFGAILNFWWSVLNFFQVSTELNKAITRKLREETELRLFELTDCYDRTLEPTILQHGNFWVLQNYVPAKQQFRCFESVTYTTQADYSFLENVIPLVERWQGPISLVLHAPGTDFQPTLDSIAYLRNCKSPLIKQFVTFHLIFDMGHAPINEESKPYVGPIGHLYVDNYDCSKLAPYINVNHRDLYKADANITYPINVARNVARESAQTHFVLASDIELYPSPNIINKFLNFIVRKGHLIVKKESPSIFVLPVFEILSNESIPRTKYELQNMFNEGRALSFHKKICNRCHAIPRLEEWMNLKDSKILSIFTITKRQKKYVRWEAVYIGTNSDPWFDERLDWEKHGNKMSQAYIMCLLNYDYMILDNVFLVHRPGIKDKMVNEEIIPKTAEYINQTLGSQINIIYGEKNGCLA